MFGMMLVGWPTTALMGWTLILFAIGMVGLAFAVRRKEPRPGAKTWLGWPIVLLTVAALFMATREVNLLLLDAGVQAPTGMAQQAKRDVAAQMKDPTSVMFTDVKEGVSVVCGMANAKNSFGTYAGPERFVWTASDGGQVESGLASTGFPGVDAMKRCMFDQDWKRCHGLPVGDVGECTALTIP